MLKAVLRRLRLLCALVPFMMASACAGEAGIAPRAPPTASATLLSAIEAAIGDAACDGPQQCHSIAIGAKACGGPDAYLAWSSKRTQQQRLSALVEQHAAARKAENLHNEILSTCIFETNPGVRCEAARCTLGPRGRGGMPDDVR